MVKISSYPASKANYGGTRALSTIKYIVIHYTANDGDTAISNAKYFANGSRGASAHYFVDSKNIVQSVKDDYVAWAVGGNKYDDTTKTGGGKFYGKCNNNNSLSIEICDDIKNNAIYPTDSTINNIIELVRTLMKKYNISINNVIRHFDVTGKKCPMYWCGDSQKNGKWQKFKNSILNSINNLPQLNLFIGNTENNKNAIYLPEKSLYQNVLITGTIGTGKTSSANVSIY